MLKKWDDLPQRMRNEAVRAYYDVLDRKRAALVCKRMGDLLIAALLLVLLSPLLLVLALAIRLDSPGPVFYRQVRVTRYGKEFRIHKFRTMVSGADRMGTQVTVNHDSRVTRLGRVLRACRLDELPQLIDILAGDMTLVGTRPEVPKYVAQYTPEMMATLLLPAGVTSLASIRYRNEAELLDGAEDVDRVYVERVLPDKMKYNLDGIRRFSLWGDVKTMFLTVWSVLKRD